MDVARVVRTLRDKQVRLQAIEREAKRLRAELEMIRNVLRSAPARRAGKPRRIRPRRRAEPDPTSPLGLALSELRASRKPLRIDRILRGIERSAGRKFKRQTVESQLSRYVQKGLLVRRTGPAEFALIALPASRARRR